MSNWINASSNCALTEEKIKPKTGDKSEYHWNFESKSKPIHNKNKQITSRQTNKTPETMEYTVKLKSSSLLFSRFRIKLIGRNRTYVGKRMEHGFVADRL